MWRLRVAYRISKQARAHARTHERARTHAHTSARARAEICNTDFFLQTQWFSERASMLRYAYVACLVCRMFVFL
jgi:hypothetical protein